MKLGTSRGSTSSGECSWDNDNLIEIEIGKSG